MNVQATSEPGPLRRGGAGQEATTPWLRSLGMAIVAVVVVTTATAGHPAPGLHGDGLGVLLALLAFAAGLLGAREARLRRAPALVQAPLLALLVAGSATLMWLQPDGPGFLGFFYLATWLATLRLPARLGLAAGGLVLVVALAVVRATGSHRPLTGILLGALALSGVYLVVVLAQHARAGQQRAERLLGELEATRAAQLRAATLAERQHLARELHDVLAHSLSGLTLQLEAARLLAAADPPDTGRLVAALERAHQLAKAGLQDARRAIGALRDDEELPGPQLLAGLAQEVERDTGVRVDLEVTGQPHELSPEARLALYRTAQEALTNVRKHGHARRVEVRLDYQPPGTRLTVEDHAADRDRLPEPAGDGYGLTGMRERAELLGGTLTAGPTAAGFRVELWVPR